MEIDTDFLNVFESFVFSIAENGINPPRAFDSLSQLDKVSYNARTRYLRICNKKFIFFESTFNENIKYILKLHDNIRMHDDGRIKIYIDFHKNDENYLGISLLTRDLDFSYDHNGNYTIYMDNRTDILKTDEYKIASFHRKDVIPFYFSCTLRALLHLKCCHAHTTILD